MENIINLPSYSSLITEIAKRIYNKISNTSSKTIANLSYTDNKGTGTKVTGAVGYGTKTYPNTISVSLSASLIENAYTKPTSNLLIERDIKSFLEKLNIPTTNTIPNVSGLLALLYALQVFIDTTVTYKNTSSSSKTYIYKTVDINKINYSGLGIDKTWKDILLTQNTLMGLYNQLKNTDMLKNFPLMSVSASTSSSSCSSSSCSSSSCSSSAFIVYLKI